MSLLTSLGHQVAVARTLSSACRRLEGKVAVVTASTDGIGLSIAERLLEEGASVVVSSRKANNVSSAVEKLSSRGRVTGIVCHVGKKEDRLNLLKTTEDKFGGIDILVSNAAVNPTVGGVTEMGDRRFLPVKVLEGPSGPREMAIAAGVRLADEARFDDSFPSKLKEIRPGPGQCVRVASECSDEAWDKIFDINVKSAFTLTKEVKPYLNKRGGGNIVYVSSITGFVPQELLGAYSVSKTTLLGLTKACAQELARDNIRVNCVAPGIIKTHFSSALHENESVSETVLMSVAMNRFGKSEEVAGVVAFLVSEDASYVTGETVVCSGGMPSRL